MSKPNIKGIEVLRELKGMVAEVRSVFGRNIQSELTSLEWSIEAALINRLNPQSMNEVRDLPSELWGEGTGYVLELLDTTLECSPEDEEFFCTDHWSDLLSRGGKKVIQRLIADPAIITPEDIMGWLDRRETRRSRA